MGEQRKGRRSLRQSLFWPIGASDQMKIRRLLRQPVGLFLSERRTDALFNFLFGTTKRQKEEEALPPIPLTMKNQADELADLSDRLRS